MSATKQFNMVDLFNLTHPKVQHASKEQAKAWKDLMEGNLPSFDTWETEISNAKNDAERTKIWESLIAEDKLGYMAMLRNLNNLIKYNVSEKTINKVVAKLSDPEEVKNSKQLPFRFVTAYKNVAGNIKFQNAISDAMEIAISNVPELPGKTLIAIDCSGSMASGAMEKAAIFGAALLKANGNSDVILYDTSVKELKGYSGRTPIIDLAALIEREAMGGGTQTSLVFQYAMKMGKKYDRIIILSDNESWVEGWGGSSVQECYKKYVGMGANPFVYAIDIQGYGTKDIDSKRVFHLTGWSDRLLDFIGRIEEGETLVDYIRNYSIPSVKVEIKKKELKKAIKTHKATKKVRKTAKKSRK